MAACDARAQQPAAGRTLRWAEERAYKPSLRAPLRMVLIADSSIPGDFFFRFFAGVFLVDFFALRAKMKLHCYRATSHCPIRAR